MSTTTGTTSQTFYFKQPNVIRTYCAFRLGDNIHHLHFMRAMAKAYPEIRFEHAAFLPYLPQLIEVVADLPNLSLRDILSCKGEPGINAWKNAAGFWENHALKAKYAEFMLVWFDELAKRMGLECPLKTPHDLIFDYPALKPEKNLDGLTLHPQSLKMIPFDFLIVNSIPMSGQWKGGNDAELNTLIQDLSQRYDVVCTRSTPLNVMATDKIHGFTVTDIGALSLYAENIIMIPTGPAWPTLNIWTEDNFRIVLQDTEELGMTQNTHQCTTVRYARRVLKERGFL